MIITDQKREEILSALKNLAKNNPHGQAYLKTSDFGFETNIDITKAVAEWLQRLPEIKTAKVIGKGLIDCVVKI